MTLEQLRAELIRQREKAGLSKEKIADKMDIPPSSFGMYELGKRNMSYKFCERYAAALEVNLSIKLIDPKTGEIIE